jgi:hypothetical protein
MRVTGDAVFDKEAAMQSARDRSEPDIEFSIGPHAARPDRRVLRVTFVRCPDHEHRVAQALETLLAPNSADESLTGNGGDHEEQVRDGLVPA